MDLDQARFNMVEQQIRTWDVLNQAVLNLVMQIPREEFVPTEYQALAYADTAIPLPAGQVMMPPRVEARMVQSLEIKAEDKVLEIGTGSGYVTALLSNLARSVISVDIEPSFLPVAEPKLAIHGAPNTKLVAGDAISGWAHDAPYDAIAVTGSVPLLENHFERQLKIGGRVFVIVGQAPAMEARVIRRCSENQWVTESLFETVVPPLIGAKHPERFVF